MFYKYKNTNYFTISKYFMENITKTINRLIEYIEYKHISLNKFSIELGVSNSYFSKMVRNNASIGSDIIEKILRTHIDLSPEWLLTGNGSMLRGKNQPISLVEEPKPLYTTRKQPDDIIDRILNRLEQQSEEIGKLKNELEVYKRGDVPGAQDAGVAVAN